MALVEVGPVAATHCRLSISRLTLTMRWAIGQTEDAKEGPRAFAEKLVPVFRGR